MRKIMVLCLVIALAFGATGATCKNFWIGAQDKVCNAPANVMAVIDGIITVAELGVATFVPGSAAYIAAIQSFGTATSIKDGLCVSLTQLNALIAYVQSQPALRKKAMAKVDPAKAVAINVQPLIDWGNSVK